jgi:hypothetical protein
MYKIIGLLGAAYFSISVQQGEAKEAVVQVNSDITVSCYFTVSVLKDSGRPSYRVVGSSPRDCGAVDETTGKLLETKVNLYCPRGYDAVGIPRGGPVGSYGVEIFYEAQGMCRSAYYLPLDAIDFFSPGVSQP